MWHCSRNMLAAYVQQRLGVLKASVLSVLILLISDCSIHSNYSAVVEKAQGVVAGVRHYRVMPGDNLFAIAWSYGVDAQAILKLNHLQSSQLKPGKVLKLPVTHRSISMHGSVPALSSDYYASQLSTRTQPHSAKSRQTPQKKPYSSSKLNQHIKALKLRYWRWPRHAFQFANLPYHGIWVHAHPVRALAPGKVVYAGRGIRGFGYLVIVQHAHHYLSAYGFLIGPKVKIGQTLVRGQTLAKRGGYKGQAYIEIRHLGRPVSKQVYQSHG